MKNKLLKRSNGGFSLVELIVVIAIMAILVGVAVPVYSSYIEKSQKAADEQLVDEIAHALEIAYVAEQFNGTATVILTTNGASVSGDSAATTEWLNNVMNTTFGDLSSLKLKYSGWTTSAFTVSQHYQNSSYIAKQENLLSDVQQLTEALETFVETTGVQFIGTDYTTFADKYGIDVTNPTEVANAASLFVAEQTKTVNTEAFVREWTRNSGASVDIASGNFQGKENLNMGLMSALAAHYARAESLATFVDSNEYSSVAFKDAQGNPCTASAWLSAQKISGNSSDAVVADMERITAAFATSLGSEMTKIITDYGKSSQARADAQAYVSMMGAIEENSDEILGNIGQQDTLYTDGTVNQLLNNYMSAGAALTEAPAGSVAVVISGNQDSYSIMIVGMKD